MALVVHKFQVGFQPTRIELPADAKVAMFAPQGDQLCIWVLLDPAAEKVPRTFTIYGTGHLVKQAREFVGSCQAGLFVWHLFEE